MNHHDGSTPGPRRVKIHAAGVRPFLLLGGERGLMFPLLYLCGMFLLALQTRWAIVFSLLVGIGGVFVLRQLAAYDPFFRQVYTRHIRYRSFYPAHSKPWVEPQSRW